MSRYDYQGRHRTPGRVPCGYRGINLHTPRHSKATRAGAL